MATDGSEPEGPRRPKRTMPKGRPFPKGVSGNPGGQPKSLAEFRNACVAASGTILAQLVAKVSAATVDEAIRIAELVMARAGALPLEVQARLEVERSRLVAQILAIETLNEAQRTQVIALCRNGPEALPALPAPEETPKP